MTGRARRATSTEPDLVVAAALRLEARALRRGARSARIVRTGMGAARARKAAAELRDRPGRALAVAGVSGALDASLEPGDIVVVSALCELTGGEPEWTELDSAPELLEILDRSGHRPSLGRLVTVDHIVHSSERSELRATGARIVDMETAHLAEGAAGRRFAAVRVVVDTPEHGFASLSFIRSGVRALRQLASLLPALEQWAAASAARPDLHTHGAAAAPQPIRRSS
ncbi:MAG: hypothetical protein JRG83_09485 [Deltaproteobacteria bacterium]|nr:hypothetical protein [Deltaproteobacteria bacterium]